MRMSSNLAHALFRFIFFNGEELIIRKHLVICITILFLLSNTMIAGSASPVNMENSTVLMNNVYGFTYSEKLNPDNSIVRTYTKDNSTQENGLITCSSGQDDYDYTRAVLVDIGLSENVVSKYSENELEKMADAKSITSIITYRHTDEQGQVSYVPEAEAQLAAVNAVSSKGLYDPDYVEVYDDEYIRVAFVFFDYHNGTYRFCVDAEWLTMPGMRLIDCISIAAQNVALIESSFSGWYEYTITRADYSLFGSTRKSSFSEDFTTADFYMSSSGTWEGVGATFNLPDDIYVFNQWDVLESATTYSAFNAYFESEAVVSYPNQIVNFNASGCYDHSTFTLSPQAQIGIGSDGGDYYLGFSLEPNSDPFPVMTNTPIHYVPSS